jgi:mannosyltransferase
MATVAPRSPLAVRARSLVGTRSTEIAAVACGLGLLLAVSLLLRTRHLGVGYWIDEGLSVGIADRPLLDIPGILRQDGSPPLYYSLLSVWIGLVGSTGESATHALSLLFALLTVPVSYVGGRICFGARAGWIAAALCALNPFLTQYAQETRMYALVMLLGTVAIWSFVAGFVQHRRRGLPVFALSLALLLYTHNWALFFGLATGVTWLLLVALEAPGARRGLLRDGALAFAAVALLYAPWLPTLVFQARHTGAPWARRPDFQQLLAAPEHLLSPVALVALVLAGGAGMATVLGRRRRDADFRAGVALLVMAFGTMIIAWGASQASPAWATRYLAVAVAPLIALAAFGLSRAGRLGVAALLLVMVMWLGGTGREEKSNVRDVAAAISPSLRAGDLVVSTQPEQVSVLAHYLPPGLRWATLWGPVADLGVTDWRDGVDRMRHTSAARDLEPLIDRLPAGRRIVLVEPTIYDLERWSAPWTALVRLRSEEWSRAVHRDPRLQVSTIYPPSPFPQHPNPVTATVLVKRPTS